MNNVALVRTVQGAEERTVERTPKTGDSPIMMCLHSVSLHPRYSRYGTRTMSVTTNASYGARGWSQISTMTLHSEVDEIRAQIIAATIQLMTCVEQTSQSIQQTTIAVGQALKCKSGV